MKITVIGFLLLILSCNGQKKAALENDKKDAVNETQLTLLVQEDHGGTTEAETLIIKDHKALKSFYSKINRTRKPGLPVPSIDFTKEIVLIHCGGELSANEHSELSISEVLDDKLMISRTKVKDLEDNSKAIKTPFLVYKMPLTSKEISFKEQD